MKNITNKAFIGIILLASILASCKDNSSSPTPSTKDTNTNENDNKEDKVEGTYAGTWELPNEKMPTEKLKNDYTMFVLIIGEDDSYEWSWHHKNGNTTVFKGTTTYEKSEYKHTSGSAIWRYSIWVNEINGQSAPGGWDGIYTYDDPQTLILNIEPRVQGWSKYPTAEDGVGSGQDGEGSVYVFSKE